MAIIDIGEFAQNAEFASKEREPIPEGVYDFQCIETSTGTYSTGRPFLSFVFELINAGDPDLNGKKLIHNVPLPNGSNHKGIGFLIELVQDGFKEPWEGISFDSDTYLGRSIRANIVHKPGNKGDGRVFANIDGFV